MQPAFFRSPRVLRPRTLPLLSLVILSHINHVFPQRPRLPPPCLRFPERPSCPLRPAVHQLFLFHAQFPTLTAASPWLVGAEALSELLHAPAAPPPPPQEKVLYASCQRRCVLLRRQGDTGRTEDHAGNQTFGRRAACAARLAPSARHPPIRLHPPPARDGDGAQGYHTPCFLEADGCLGMNIHTWLNVSLPSARAHAV
ncbi:hypothetical protein OBBRIDRAFT_604699 [Obba rivulosa]|uniref:Uncharacterized protein n=1 Tax=Obba rivulosa TaxID=1052685 RepID=A0A8E2ATZ6_9APHY|nr:hypothetical protein OBBRIDRAFT_604699 [Obba rivulosa]